MSIGQRSGYVDGGSAGGGVFNDVEQDSGGVRPGECRRLVERFGVDAWPLGGGLVGKAVDSDDGPVEIAAGDNAFTWPSPSA
jgi:hypothetical protein